MRKFSTLIGASVLALATVAGSAIAAPQGFAQGGAHANGPRGFNQIQTMTVSQVKKHSFDDQKVTLVGRLTKFVGKDCYEFQDQTGSILVELDDDRNWSHINKDQQIRIFAEVDKDWDRITLDVKRANPVR